MVKRPRSLAILVALQVLQGLGLLAYGMYVGKMFGWGYEKSYDLLRIAPLDVFEIISSGYLFLGLAFVTLMIGLALWFMQGWAWLLAMALQGISLMTALVGYLRDRPNYISMVLGILLVYYLNQQEIQAVFRRKAG